MKNSLSAGGGVSPVDRPRIRAWPDCRLEPLLLCDYDDDDDDDDDGDGDGDDDDGDDDDGDEIGRASCRERV